MARGIAKKDFDYEVEYTNTDGEVVPAVLMWISMDKFNTGTADTKIKESTSTVTRIKAHLTLNKNEREYGIHPRHAVCEYSEALTSSKCYGTAPKRIVHIPILTIAQFADLKVYDEETGGTQAKTTLVVNHSFDGSTNLTYKIRELVPQRNV